MADKADDIRQELEKGRQDIAATRSALTGKLVVLGDRVQETVDGVKHTFDLHYQVKQRPWLMFGASLLVGYALGRRGAPRTTADRSNAPSSNAQAAEKYRERNKQPVYGRAFHDQRGRLWSGDKHAMGDGQTVAAATGSKNR